MNIFRTLQYITEHPLTKQHKLSAIKRFVKWQLVSRVFSSGIVVPFTKKTKLIIRNGMAGATGNFYCGLHEFSDMAFTLHLLRKEDLFIDIGANIGSYTILASGHVGSKTLAFEPSPSTFENLKNNISINHIDGLVRSYNMALGSNKGQVNFTKSFDTINHVANPGEVDIIEVSVDKLDNILAEGEFPLLIKVDVEGFETEVIKGALNTLNCSQLQSIIIELNGSGARYGFDELEIHQKLVDYGFSRYTYEPFSRKLIPINDIKIDNYIYVKDLSFIEQRLKSAERINILGIEF